MDLSLGIPSVQLNAPLGILAFGHQCALPKAQALLQSLRNLCIWTPINLREILLASCP